jgi:hypothetical protein
MSVRELIAVIGEYQIPVAIVLAAVPVLTLLLGMMHDRGQGGKSSWRYAYAVLVYLACVPGIFAAVITGYTMMFVKGNLLDANAVVYFLPIVSMVATLMIMGRRVDFDDIPGFDRLWGLMVLLGMTFVVLLAIEKTRIWIVFGGGFGALLAIAALVFALLKWGGYMVFRRRDEPKIDMPL